MNREPRPVSTFENELAAELEGIRAAGLYRELRRVDSIHGTRLEIAGRRLLSFCSNDYLGLAGHPALREAAARAALDFGAGAGASRLVSGSLAAHHELEETLAEFKATAAALVFSTGYATALGTIAALVGKEDVLLTDKLVHACVVDAARLSGARLRIFHHNDVEDLEAKLKWAAALPRVACASGRAAPRILIVTESVFSMDGDLAPLREIIELKDKYGAWLMLDEAHATGLFGEHRRGLAEAQELAERVEIQMGTLGKALGVAGGYICGARPLIDLLINRARSFLFSTAPVPAAAAAATAAVRLVQSSEGESRRQQLWQNVDAAKNAVIHAGWTLPAIQSAILPMMIGEEEAAVAIAAELRAGGLFIPAIRYPTVAHGRARLRLTLSAAHAETDVLELGRALATVKQPSAS